jgi:hypothetical protein
MESPWMNDMRGIEFGFGCASWFCAALAGLDGLLGDVYPGLRAARFTPDCHIAGLRPWSNRFFREIPPTFSNCTQKGFDSYTKETKATKNFTSILP